MVFTKAAVDVLDMVDKAFQLCQRDDAAVVLGMCLCVKRCTISAHQPGDGGADGLKGHFLFKGAQYGVV
ncbi:hypothetical protein SDC9_160775 [bioreactor metagenome]|uniref:Uncharacterized protein n=1 Tax=bioreactor metagenome TaxID=1076179 RepID=A0A645FM19_9ZZZZ